MKRLIGRDQAHQQIRVLAPIATCLPVIQVSILYSVLLSGSEHRIYWIGMSPINLHHHDFP